MDRDQFRIKRYSPNKKIMAQSIVILVLEMIVFVVIYKYKFTNDLHISQNPNHSTLIFVQILFRHGERTPLVGRSYTNDPYINYTFNNAGGESLTYKGVRTMYELGKYLRKYYGDFLENYHANTVFAVSSHKIRCRDSLLLTLASLFPSPKEKQLNYNLRWEPIEYHYNSSHNDYLFYTIANCEKFAKLRDEESNRILHDTDDTEMRELLKYLELYIGEKIETSLRLYEIADLLEIQLDMGLKLPNWTEKIFPQPMKSIAYKEVIGLLKTDVMKRLFGGFLLKDMIDAMQQKLRDSIKFSQRKIHLYSGHDFNIWALFGILGIVLTERPPCGSFMAMELHKIDNNFGVKMFYRKHKSELPLPIKVPKCELFCPIEKFLQLHKKYEATSDMCSLDYSHNM